MNIKEKLRTHVHGFRIHKTTIRKYMKYRQKFAILVFFFLIIILLFCFKISHHSNWKRDQLITYFGENSSRNYEMNSIDNDFYPSRTKHSIFSLDFLAEYNSSISSDEIDDSRADLILIWTLYFDYSFLSDPILDANRHIYDVNKTFHRPAYCEKKYPNCRLTADKQYLKRSDMVVFHWPDLNLNNIPYPHESDQIWMLFSIESPKYVPKLPNTVHVSFNATSLYHSQSDIPIPYGETNHFRNEFYKPDINNKILPIVWLVSHCFVSSKREEYVRQMQEFIKIDVYGVCSPDKRCHKGRFDDCHKRLYSRYYFYLAFENAICDEYVTEKVFLALQHDIVPIVYGGANYTQILPPHSFIDATKHRPKDLAILVKSLISNQTAYLEYFEWKKSYKVHGQRRSNDYMICEACRYIQRWKNGEISRKSITLKQINQYWTSTCWPDERVDELLQN